MSIVLLFIILLILNNAKFVKETPLNEDYLTKEQTTTVNGVFVLLVFMSHANQYMAVSGDLHSIYLFVSGFLTQAIVVTFLFYSGYGIMESIKRKGQPYVNTIFTKMIKLLIQFDIAILLFLLTNWFIGNRPTIKEVLLAMTSWTSIGNSNWYITAILLLYLFTFISFKFFKNHWFALISLTVLTMAYVFLMLKLGRPGYTYNTMICFSFGVFYSQVHLIVEKYLKNNLLFLLSLLITLVTALYTRQTMYHDIKMYSLWMICFMIFILFFTMKTKLNSPFLYYMGTKVFSVYILQRIPMMILKHYGFQTHTFTFFTISFVITLILAIIFDKYINSFIDYLLDFIIK